LNQLDDWPVFGIFAGGLTTIPNWIQCRSLPALSVLLPLHYIARSEWRNSSTAYRERPVQSKLSPEISMLWKRSYKNRMTSSAIPASKTMNGVLRWPRYCGIPWTTARWHSTTSHLRLDLMQNPREPWKEQVTWQTGTTTVNHQPRFLPNTSSHPFSTNSPFPFLALNSTLWLPTHLSS